MKQRNWTLGLTAALVTALGISAPADTLTWTGPGFSWDSPNAWYNQDTMSQQTWNNAALDDAVLNGDLGLGGGAIVVNSITINGPSTFIKIYCNPLTIHGGITVNAGVTGEVRWWHGGEPRILGADQIFLNDSSASFTIKPLVLNGYDLTLAGSGSGGFSFNNNPVITGIGDVTVAMTGAGIVYFSNNSAHDGDTYIESGTLRASATLANLGTGTIFLGGGSADAELSLSRTLNTPITVLDGAGTATISAYGGFNSHFGAPVYLAGDVVLGNPGWTMIVGEQYIAGTGVITGPGGVTVPAGSTVQIKSTGLTYEGDTVIFGTVQQWSPVNWPNTIPDDSTVVVYAPGLLQYNAPWGSRSDTIGGVDGDGTISGFNTLNVTGPISGNVTLTGGSVVASGGMHVEIDGTTGDQTTLNGAITLSGPITVNAVNPPFASSYVILVNDGTDPINGTFDNQCIDGGAAAFEVIYNGGDGNDVELLLVDCSAYDAAFLGALCTSFGANTPTSIQEMAADALAVAEQVVTDNGLSPCCVNYFLTLLP